MSAPPRLDPIPLPADAGGAVRLYRADLDHARWSELFPLLSEPELRRAERFRLARDARRYVVSHAVLRTVLGELTQTAPAAVTLGTAPQGRPILLGGGSPLHFSLSRSEDHMLIGVASCPVGVDLEWLAPSLDVAALAEAMLSTREGDAFRLTPPEHGRTVLLGCWTQKEAVLKASGKGLSIAPETVEVLLTQDAALSRSLVVACLGARWQVHTILPLPGYVGAVATPARAGDGADARFGRAA